MSNEYSTEYICCEATDCMHNEDYRCARIRIHIDADGKCLDYNTDEK